jgi:hypothetical protein
VSCWTIHRYIRLCPLVTLQGSWCADRTMQPYDCISTARVWTLNVPLMWAQSMRLCPQRGVAVPAGRALRGRGGGSSSTLSDMSGSPHSHTVGLLTTPAAPGGGGGAVASVAGLAAGITTTTAAAANGRPPRASRARGLKRALQRRWGGGRAEGLRPDRNAQEDPSRIGE